MNELLIDYIDFIPQNLKEIKRYIENAKKILPNWLNHLVVISKTDYQDDLGGICSCEVAYEYRQGKIVINKSFWDEINDKLKQKFIFHECFHFVLAPLVLLQDSFIKATYPDKGPLHTFSLEQHRIAFESVVQDLANCWMKFK